MEFMGRQVQSVEVEMVIIRADGQREPQPTSRWHRNPLKRLAWWLERRLRRTGAAHGQG